jgi:hypothetical protein
MGKVVIGVKVTRELQPEARWMVDPNDYLRPMVYDPKDARWAAPGKAARVERFCGSAGHRD